MITLGASVEDFLLVKRAGQRATSTIKWYAKYLNPFVAVFGAGLALDDLTMHDVATWLAGQKGSMQTRHNRDRALRTFFTWSADVYSAPSPMRGIPHPLLPDPEPKAIEIDDLNRLIEVARTVRDVAILLVLADCGLRAGGLVGLLIDDVDFAARLLRVREKGSRVRAVPFSLDTERALDAWCKCRPRTADRLFCTYIEYGAGPLTYWGLHRVIRRLADRAGFTNERCNLHSFRHFAAREYLRQGGSLPALARILGHDSMDTTARYYAVYAASELAEVHDAHSPLNSLKKGTI